MSTTAGNPWKFVESSLVFGFNIAMAGYRDEEVHLVTVQSVPNMPRGPWSFHFVGVTLTLRIRFYARLLAVVKMAVGSTLRRPFVVSAYRGDC